MLVGSMNGDLTVSNKPKEYLTNHEINSGSILLYFKDGDEIIARNWQNSLHQLPTLSDNKAA